MALRFARFVTVHPVLYGSNDKVLAYKDTVVGKYSLNAYSNGLCPLCIRLLEGIAYRLIFGLSDSEYIHLINLSGYKLLFINVFTIKINQKIAFHPLKIHIPQNCNAPVIGILLYKTTLEQAPMISYLQ